MSGWVKSDGDFSTFSLRHCGARAGSTGPYAIGDDFMVLVYIGHEPSNISDEDEEPLCVIADKEVVKSAQI